MKRSKTRKRKDRAIFKKTANSSLSVNQKVVAMRGGTRL